MPQLALPGRRGAGSTSELLLRCLHGDRQDIIDDLTHQPERLVQTATAHKLECLLWQRLSTLDLASILPPATRAMLVAQVSYQRVLSARRQQQLAELLDGLNGAAVPVVVLKGAYLATVVYEEPALRPMTDVDILCQPQDLPQVQALLLDLGYQPLNEETIEESCAYHHQLAPMLRQGDASVDIHWRIERPITRLRIDHAALWQRSRPWCIAGRKTRVLAPEDLLLHLCLHLAHHHRCRVGLYALVDVARLIQQQALDWSSVVSRARAWQGSFPLALALGLAKDLAAAAVPDTVLEALLPHAQRRYWLRIAKREILTPPYLAEATPSSDLARTQNLLQALQDPKSTPGWWGIVMLVKARLWPPREQLARYYPHLGNDYRLMLMYPLHGCLLSLRYLKALFRHWGHWRNTWKLARKLGT